MRLKKILNIDWQALAVTRSGGAEVPEATVDVVSVRVTDDSRGVRNHKDHSRRPARSVQGAVVVQSVLEHRPQVPHDPRQVKPSLT